MTVNYETYMNEKLAFLKKHSDWHIETSPMDEYGRYYKHYICEDDAVWCEEMTPTYEKTTVEIKLVKVDVEVKMLRTEYYSSDDAKSRFYYEKF